MGYADFFLIFIHFSVIYFKKLTNRDISCGEYYCARCLDIDVFTQGKTIDEVIKNLKEAVSLHIEDEKIPENSILTIMEIKPLKVRA